MTKDLFIKLTQTTNPHSSWNEYKDKLLSNIGLDLSRDIWGNYYIKIGESKNMFTCHLDTAGEYTEINHKFVKKGTQEFITTDGTSVLGADDKAGIVVLVNMINKNIPGLYYFFIGEEAGGKGSKEVAGNFYNLGHTNDIKHVISFDRKAYTSIITHQMETRCCSEEFADSLVKQFTDKGLPMIKDNTGALSDSMSFYHIPQICEITNVSVGYFNEHTNKEYQNITFLDKLSKVVCDIKWDKLETEPIKESYLIRKFSTFIRK